MYVCGFGICMSSQDFISLNVLHTVLVSLSVPCSVLLYLKPLLNLGYYVVDVFPFDYGTKVFQIGGGGGVDG